MQARFTPVTSTITLDDVMRAAEDPVILFKHDPFCSISTYAYYQVAEVPHKVALIDVARNKDVARAVTERTQIKHESPQVIVLHNGRVVWSASHYAITQQAVEQAVEQACEN